MRSLFGLCLLLLAAACASAPAPLAGGRYVETAGGDVYVKEWGNPDGAAVLMIHGTTAHLQEFEVSLGPTLAADYRLVAYDRPGMGRSRNRTSSAETLAVQAQTAADVIRALGLDQPVVAGHSYGGAVALRLALDAPDLVSGLVLLAPASHPWDGGAPSFIRAQAAPVLGEVVTTLSWPFTSGAARNSLRNRVFAPRAVPDGYYEDADVALAMRPAQVRASSKDFSALPGELREQVSRYGEIAAPVAIIAGEDDRIAPIAVQARQMDSPFQVSHLIILPGVGHMPQHAEPGIVKREIEWVFETAKKDR